MDRICHVSYVMVLTMTLRTIGSYSLCYNLIMSENTPDTVDIVTVPNLRTLKNGAVYDMDKKRIVANPGGGSAALTKASASALAHKRWDMAREAAAAGLVRLSPSNKTEYDAWANVNENMGRIATDYQSNAAVKAAEFVGRAAGLLPTRTQQQDHTEADPLRDLGAELARRLLAWSRSE